MIPNISYYGGTKLKKRRPNPKVKKRKPYNPKPKSKRASQRDFIRLMIAHALEEIKNDPELFKKHFEQFKEQMERSSILRSLYDHQKNK